MRENTIGKSCRKALFLKNYGVTLEKIVKKVKMHLKKV